MIEYRFDLSAGQVPQKRRSVIGVIREGSQHVREGSLYKVCHRLFSTYPLAVTAPSASGDVRSMVLMLRDGDEARFFVVEQDSSKNERTYSLRPWRAPSIADTGGDCGAAQDVAVEVVTRAVPMPDDRSLFGWRHQDAVTALIAVTTTFTPACPEPCWGVMPLADTADSQWPPFTDQCLFGSWFWEHLQARNIVAVSDLIARNPGTVFWVNTEEILGSDSCVVAHDIWIPGGPALRRGRFVYSDALRDGRPVPSVNVLLADNDKTDMALEFRPSI